MKAKYYGIEFDYPRYHRGRNVYTEARDEKYGKCVFFYVKRPYKKTIAFWKPHTGVQMWPICDDLPIFVKE